MAVVKFPRVWDSHSLGKFVITVFRAGNVQAGHLCTPHEYIYTRSRGLSHRTEYL